MAEGTVAQPIDAETLAQPAVVTPLAVPTKPRKKVSSLAEKQAALKSVK